MTSLRQPKFVQITGDNNYGLTALDEEGNVWDYVRYYNYDKKSIATVDLERTGWYPKVTTRHASTS